MFYLQELLSRRDSGFGLIWLAATLGPKSSFKKLPRRSVMTADISALCNLIAEPEEPLALRLSSNLMIGVARIYKVKQEIFYGDVTTCFNTLKKAVQDIHTMTSAAAQLQMGQPSVRPDAVTAAIDPTVAFAMDFDYLFGDWDQPLTQAQSNQEEVDIESDDEYDPSGSKKSKKKPKSKGSPISLAEQGRADLHKLQEDHSYLLSSSLHEAFQDAGGVGPSSSQFGGGFQFDDNFLEGVDLGGDIGDELARELGEGWGASPIRLDDAPLTAQDAAGIDIPEPIDGGMDFQFEEGPLPVHPGIDVQMVDNLSASARGSAQPGLEAGSDDPVRADGSIIYPLSPLGSQAGEGGQGDQPKQKKAKRVRLLLDARTELTNEELERARANYLEGQARLRREMEQKKIEKESARLIEEMIWGAPQGVEAPVLIDFWQENFRVQVEARSGKLHLITEGEPPRKRRRLEDDGQLVRGDRELDEARDWGIPGDDVNLDFGNELGGGGYDVMQDDMNLDSRMRSSEEPGQARRASSRPLSILGSQFELGAAPAPDLYSGSQRSNLFPWDNAGVSSSISGAVFRPGGSDRLSVGRADSRLRGSSLGRDSGPFGVPESPGSFGLPGSHRDNAFEFDVPGDEPVEGDSQLSNASLMTLERNSFNFLEYAKMQHNAFPSSTLKFSDVVPTETSTRHVAAAAFYHCLVLTTKDLLGVKQEEPYGSMEVNIK